MHSLKNTVVAVLLLGVSYGVYNVMSTPDRVPESDMIGPISIDSGTPSTDLTQPPAGQSMTLPGTADLKQGFDNLAGNVNSFAGDVRATADNAVESAGNAFNNSNTFRPPGTPQLSTTSPPPLAQPRNVNRSAPSTFAPSTQTQSPSASTSGGGSFALPSMSDSAPPVQNASTASVPDAREQLIPGSIVQRQPQFDFAPDDSRNRTASAVAPVNNNQPNASVSEDRVLIDALKQELEPADDIFVGENTSTSGGGFAPPASSFASTAANAPGIQPPTADSSNALPPQIEFAPSANASFGPPETVAPVANVAANRTPEPSTGPVPLAAIWPAVEKLIDEQNYRGALGTLSRYYTDPNLTEMETENLMTWLDSLAGKVIYSPEHNLFRKAYVVQPGETLSDIARRWEVTSQLIYNVNRPNITNPSELTAGTEIKMVSGPFHAEINSETGVMTLFVKNLYAGRFNIQLSDDSQLNPGTYAVIDKSRENLMSDNWTITLEGGVVIKTIAPGESVSTTCIGLNPDDAGDVFGILTGSSRVFVK